MAQKTLNSPLPCGADYVKHCKKHKALKSYRYAGDHFTVEGPDGRATIADNKRELAPWLRRKIMLELIAIGLGIVVLAVILRPVLA